MAKTTATITLRISEIIYEVHNKSYLTGRSRDNGKNHEEVAHMQSNDDEENINQILESIGVAFTKLKTKLHEYEEENAVTAGNVQIDGNTDLSITLQMPSNYNGATLDDVARECHSYIVNMTLGDWFLITNKNDSRDYYEKAALNIEGIREAINKRKRPKRKPL